MKLLETLTTAQKIDLFGGSPVGIFNTLILDTDPFFSSKYQLCLGYYTMRSGEKTISPTYEKMLEFVTSNPDTPQTAEELLAQVIRGKFLDKWSRVYDALITQQYNPLNSYEENEDKTGDNKDTRTYNTQVDDDGNTNTSLRTVSNDDGEAGLYGFNSSSPVPSSVDKNQNVEVVTGNKDENTTHNTEKKTGTEELASTVKEGITRTGRKEAGADLIEKELNLRNANIFYDIVYADIDSVATLQIYI